MDRRSVDSALGLTCLFFIPSGGYVCSLPLSWLGGCTLSLSLNTRDEVHGRGWVLRYVSLYLPHGLAALSKVCVFGTGVAFIKRQIVAARRSRGAMICYADLRLVLQCRHLAWRGKPVDRRSARVDARAISRRGQHEQHRHQNEHRIRSGNVISS